MAIKNITFLRAMTAEDKQPQQVKSMVGSIVAAEALNVPMELSAAVALITPDLQTRQTPERILAYYVPAMVTAGLIEVEKTAAKPKLTDEEKAAKAAEKAAAKEAKAAAKAAGKSSKKAAPANVADELGEDAPEESLGGEDLSVAGADEAPM